MENFTQQGPGASNEELILVSAKSAAEICGRYELGPAAKKFLRDDATPRQFLGVLIEKEQYLDAVRFLSFALPKKEAVQWACLCARHILRVQATARESESLRAAERWVMDPSDDNRRAAMAAAEKEGLGSPAGCAALAAFLSGGSLAPTSVATVPPGEHLTAQVAAGAIMLAAVIVEPEKAPEKYRVFLAHGLDLAKGLKPRSDSR